MRKINVNITNVLATLFLIMGLMMFGAWFFLGLKEKQLIGLEANYILYAIGSSVFLYLIPEEKIKELIIKWIEKQING